MLLTMLEFLILVFSIVMLAYSSDYFTEGAARIARRLGVSRFIVGAVVIGFGTSSPELFSSVYASLREAGGVAIGNVIGSNIANIGLILGSAAFIRPAVIRQKVEYLNATACLLLSLLAAVLILAGGGVSRTDGALLLLVFAAYIYYSVKNPNNAVYARDTGEDAGRAVLHLVFGLAGVLAGSVLLVNSAVAIARALGVPESVIGLTLVAFGTSVPELAVSLVAAKKGYYTMVVGNVVGSNIFNILLVLGAAALAAPIAADAAIAQRSTPAMLAITAAMLLFMRTGWRVSRGEGLLLLLFYIAFIAASFGTA
ncbi:MAG: calcium/sodium antiporter [Euryarchaeota archaeon]|nr:calcium/sodium antiporter [Euryarchaeota archaeon]